MFADIMFPVLGMGIDVELVENVGPVIGESDRAPPPTSSGCVSPIPTKRCRRSSRRCGSSARSSRRPGGRGLLRRPVHRRRLPDRGQAVARVREGKTLMYREPAVWHALLEKLAGTFIAYVRAQADAGADVIQVFDSWVGALAPADYDEFVAPYSERILAALDVPTIHFGTGDRDPARRDGRRRRRRDRPRLAHPARPRLGEVGDERGVQGNLDPARPARAVGARGGGERSSPRAAGGRPGHIFNLGHGVLPRDRPGRRSADSSSSCTRPPSRRAVTCVSRRA